MRRAVVLVLVMMSSARADDTCDVVGGYEQPDGQGLERMDPAIEKATKRVTARAMYLGAVRALADLGMSVEERDEAAGVLRSGWRTGSPVRWRCRGTEAVVFRRYATVIVARARSVTVNPRCEESGDPKGPFRECSPHAVATGDGHLPRTVAKLTVMEAEGRVEDFKR